MSEPMQTNGSSKPDPKPVTSSAASPDNFHGIAGQRALPDTPARPAADQLGVTVSTPTTPASQRSNSSASDDEPMPDHRESTGSTTTTRGGRRKKKPQKMFLCTGYGICDLSFTRSEHLSRHIRKHTGERPFQCHCTRRFSRLDNLRQHAQTVHANEDIPAGSLAIQGGRFKRSPKAAAPNRRTQPIRQGPAAYHPAHRRNVHSMPVNSMPPMYNNHPDHRRAPVQMHIDPRGPAFSGPAFMGGYPQPEEQQSYQLGPYTPVSNRSSGTFDANYSPGMGSPSFAYAGDRFPPRRQSISYSASPFYGHASSGPPQLPPLHAGLREGPQGNNMFDSPTSSAPSQHALYSRREESLASDPRRRTWHHRGEFNYMASGLQNVTNTPPEEQREHRYPEYSHTQARENGTVQLPPITSFDRAPPMSPRRHAQSPSPMEGANRPMYFSPEQQHYARFGPSLGDVDGTQRNMHASEQQYAPAHQRQYSQGHEQHYAPVHQHQYVQGHEQQHAPAQNLSRDFHRMEIRHDGAAAEGAAASPQDFNQVLDPRMRDSEDADAANVLSSLREQRP